MNLSEASLKPDQAMQQKHSNVKECSVLLNCAVRIEGYAGEKTLIVVILPSSPLPQLHDTGNIPRGEDPPDVVEVSNKDAAICTTGQSQGRKQLVALCLTITARAGDAAAPSIS